MNDRRLFIITRLMLILALVLTQTGMAVLILDDAMTAADVNLLNGGFSSISGLASGSGVSLAYRGGEGFVRLNLPGGGQHLLKVITTGAGSGSVSSNPAGIACPGDCSELCDYGTLVTLTATADSNSTFEGWSGAGCSGTDDCTVTMNAPKEVTASFAKELPIPPTGSFEVFLPLAQMNH